VRYREKLMEAFRQAPRAARVRENTISKAAICRFYLKRVGAARSWDDLREVTLEDLHEFLRRESGARRSLAASKGALRRALHDLNRSIAGGWFGLRTNGSLWVEVPAGAELDSPGADVEAGGALLAAEPQASYGTRAQQDTIRMEGRIEGGVVRLVSSAYVLREGASVEVLATRGDVQEEPWAPRTFPVRLLTSLVAYGGDALVDSEAEPD
jgi:hypothetical protein